MPKAPRPVPPASPPPRRVGVAPESFGAPGRYPVYMKLRIAVAGRGLAAGPGVFPPTSGYAGGRVKNPTYEQVSSGGTGHAEVVQVVYDPARIRYERLLEGVLGQRGPPR